MKDYSTDWSKAEFKAYLLLFCANADFIETKEERELIKSKVDAKTYKKIHEEFDWDNDFQSLQKIVATAERHNYSKSQIKDLMNDIKTLFMSDEEYSILERNLMLGLKRFLK